MTFYCIYNSQLYFLCPTHLKEKCIKVIITVIEYPVYKDAICDNTLMVGGQSCIVEEFLYAIEVKLVTIQITIL